MMSISPKNPGLLCWLIAPASMLILSGTSSAEAPGWRSAVGAAETLIAKSRRIGGDEHALQAREVLDPWWDRREIPAKLRLQKATLLQRDHHFEEALAELNQVLRRNPELAEAWLIKSTILTVSGRYEAARQAAVPLFALSSPLVALTAGTVPTSRHGNLAESYRILEAAVDKHPAEATGVRAWTYTALAEMAMRMGRSEAADEHFRSAFQLDPFSPYLIKSYANHLLDNGRAENASGLVEPHREHFPVVWMRVRKALDADRDEMAGLMSSYEAALARENAEHGHSHGRDEAVYYLEIKGDPHEAFHQALGNWESQREAADLLIFLKTAIAVKSDASLAEARRWVREREGTGF